MKPHPTWGLIKGDATDIHNFRGFVVHILARTMVQIAAHKQDTNIQILKTLQHTTETYPLTRDAVST